MEQQFFENEFERFLKENADKHRMYPSDGVWTNIYRHFHSGRRGIAVGAMLLLLLTGFIWLASSNSSRKPSSFTNSTNASLSAIQPESSPASSVSVLDIIEKLRAKSLVLPVSLAAPLSLSPLQLVRTKKIVPVNPIAFQPTALEASLLEYTRWNSAKNLNTTIPHFEIAQTKQPLATASIASNLTRLSDPVGLHKRKLTYLLSFAPSIGYRNLFGSNTQVSYGNSPLMVRHLNINQFVDHQPAIGFELGGGIRYQVSRGFSVRTGLQLNFTRYAIAAFSHAPEKTTLSLNNDLGYQNDTLVAYSNVRNLSGNDPEQLQNQFLQVSIPLAAELMLFHYSRFQVNIAGSLQPVYLLNTNQYLLSNDFSNYVKAPSLIRRFNMATSLEAFISYSTRDIRWQVGPQFRYNLFSSYKKQYPIHENLMEYGLKFGVSKTIY